MKSPASYLKLISISLFFLDDKQKSRVLQENMECSEELKNYMLDLKVRFPILSGLSIKQREFLLRLLNDQAKDGWESLMEVFETSKQQNKSCPNKLRQLIMENRGA